MAEIRQIHFGARCATSKRLEFSDCSSLDTWGNYWEPHLQQEKQIAREGSHFKEMQAAKSNKQRNTTAGFKNEAVDNIINIQAGMVANVVRHTSQDDYKPIYIYTILLLYSKLFERNSAVPKCRNHLFNTFHYNLIWQIPNSNQSDVILNDFDYELNLILGRAQYVALPNCGNIYFRCPLF